MKGFSRRDFGRVAMGMLGAVAIASAPLLQSESSCQRLSASSGETYPSSDVSLDPTPMTSFSLEQRWNRNQGFRGNQKRRVPLEDSSELLR